MLPQIMQKRGTCLLFQPPHKCRAAKDEFCQSGLIFGPSSHLYERSNMTPHFVASEKRSSASWLVAICLGAALAAGCGSGLGDSTGSTCPSDSTLTYANFGQAFIQDHCLACHNAGGPESPTLSTLAQVQAHISDIDRAAAAGPNTVNTYMPEGSSVPEAERRKLGEWLACGAKE